MGRISASTLKRALAESRRGDKRYDIALTLRFAALHRGDLPATGTGESVNVSRTGMLFRCEGRLALGDSLVAVLDWPVAARDNEPLKLVVTGHVVRTRRGLVAMVIHTHRLLREHELEKRTQLFWARGENPGRSERKPLQGLVVLIEEADDVAQLVSAVVTPQNWAVERADVQQAQRILESGEPPVSLLVTRTPELLNALKPDIPAILTIDENAPEDAPEQIAAHPLRLTVRRPLTDVRLRGLIGILCGSSTRSASSHSGNWTH